MPSDSSAAMHDFLSRAGWGAASVTPLAGDASTRRYFRVALPSRKAMLMDQPQNAEAPVAAPDATPEQRRALGYNAVAQLAGGDCGRFVAAANYLRERGLTAPDIYAADLENGFILLEDLGDDLYFDLMENGADEHTLYSAAIDALAKLHAESAPAFLAPDKPLLHHDEIAQLAETDLITEWFMPVALGRAATDAETTEHRALWREVLKAPLAAPTVFAHRDYHAQNLLWLPERRGIARVGMLDFQDAVAATKSLDLISLIEDARRDVSPELGEAMTQRYLADMREQGMPLEEEEFRAQAAAIAAQRNAKIAGIFARLYKRDGKPRYLNYLPRVWGYLNKDLEHPAMAPLKRWYDRVIPVDVRGTPKLEGLPA